MKQVYSAPELEVELFDTVVMDLVEPTASDVNLGKNEFDITDDFNVTL